MSTATNLQGGRRDWLVVLYPSTVGAVTLILVEWLLAIAGFGFEQFGERVLWWLIAVAMRATAVALIAQGIWMSRYRW